MARYHLDDSAGVYILKKLKHLGPQYRGRKLGPGVWWFSHPLEKIVAKVEKLDKRRRGEMPWMPEEELRGLFQRYFEATGNTEGLIKMAESVISWRSRTGVPTPSWVEDIYKSATPW